MMGVCGGALGAVMVVVTACAGAPTSPPPPPSEAAAIAYLHSIVAMVAAGDPFAICEVGSGTCTQILRGSDLARVPTTPPVVVGSTTIEPTRLPGGTWNAGGRVLQLCGRDGLGEPYSSEILVFEDQGRLISTATPYWLGIRIAETPIVAGSRPSPPCPSM